MSLICFSMLSKGSTSMSASYIQVHLDYKAINMLPEKPNMLSLVWFNYANCKDFVFQTKKAVFP